VACYQVSRVSRAPRRFALCGKFGARWCMKPDLAIGALVGPHRPATLATCLSFFVGSGKTFFLSLVAPSRARMYANFSVLLELRCEIAHLLCALQQLGHCAQSPRFEEAMSRSDSKCTITSNCQVLLVPPYFGALMALRRQRSRFQQCHLRHASSGRHHWPS